MGVKKALNIAVNILLWAIVVVSAIVTILVFTSQSNGGVPNLFGVSPISIQTESMKPTLNKGDLIFSKKVDDINSLKKDDIISFWTIINNKRAINTHKIEEINGSGDSISFRTRGVNNDKEDEKIVYPADVIAKYSGSKLPVAGAVLTFLQTATGFLICIVLPLVIFFIFQLYKFIKTIAEIKRETTKELTEEQKKAAVAEYLAMKEKEETAETTEEDKAAV